MRFEYVAMRDSSAISVTEEDALAKEEMEKDAPL